MRRFFIGLLAPLALCLAMPASAQPDINSTITRILNARGLWGKDFPASLASLPLWNRAGERSIWIFPDRIVATTPAKTQEEAQPRRAALERVLGQRPPSAAPAFATLLRGVADRPLALQIEVAPFFDDDTFRVGLTSPGAQFLAPGLTVSQVESLIGRPDSVTTQLIQNERERRPIVLTLRSYAQGSIVFAESDWAPTPDLVDRVLLDVPVVSNVVFGTPQ